MPESPALRIDLLQRTIYSLYDSNYELSLRDHFLREKRTGRRLHHTSVRNLPLFHLTVSSTPRLRSMILYPDFEWNCSKEACINTSIRAIVSLLWPTVRSCDLAPHGIDSSFLEGLSFDSLRISSSSFKYITAQEVDGPPLASDRSSLYSLFSLPDLQRLSLRRVPLFWPSSETPLPSMRPAPFSELTHLSNTDDVVMSFHMLEILGWPKALRSLHSHTTRYREFKRSRWPKIAVKSIHALALHSESLEELLISGDFGPAGAHSTTVGTLRQFAKLKRLGLPKAFILSTDNVTRSGRLGDSWPMDQADTDRHLPPALEELQVGMTTRFLWERYSGNTVLRHGDIEEAAKEMSVWLCRFAQHKQVGYPRLRRVVLRHHNIPQSRELAPWVDIDRFTACPEFLAVFKAEDIQFAWALNGAPPVFSI